MKVLNTFIILFILLFSSCKESNAYDCFSLESFNRRVYAFNRGLDSILFDPASIIYADIIPKKIKDFALLSLDYTYEFQNIIIKLYMYDLKFIGNGLSINELDFRSIFYFYGYKKSKYLLIPVIGPSTIRDFFCLVLSQIFVPQFYFIKDFFLYYFFEILIRKNQILFDNNFFNKNMVDGYSFLKDVYLQNINYNKNIFILR